MIVVPISTASAIAARRSGCGPDRTLAKGCSTSFLKVSRTMVDAVGEVAERFAMPAHVACHDDPLLRHRLQRL